MVVVVGANVVVVGTVVGTGVAADVVAMETVVAAVVVPVVARMVDATDGELAVLPFGFDVAAPMTLSSTNTPIAIAHHRFHQALRAFRWHRHRIRGW